MLAGLAPGSFPPGAARGNIIRRIAVGRRIPIERQRIVLVDLRVEIRWRIVRQGRDSRSADRAATCRVLVMVERAQAIVAEALAAVATMVSVAVMASAAPGREAERTG